MSGITDIDFDLGTSSSPVASGWVGVPLVQYSASRGYGWQNIGGMTAVDRGSPGPLNRDFHGGLSGTFNVDVPPGSYVVTTTLGDKNEAHIGTYLFAEGLTFAANVTTKAGEFVQSTGTVRVSDGQLNLSLFSLNSPAFALNSIQIHRLPDAIIPTANAGPSRSAVEGSAVTFSGTATGFSAASYSWDFGDGTGATGTLNPAHIYRDNGIYQATLTVTDGRATARSSATVTVANQAPTAVILAAPATSPEGTPITLGSVVTDPSPADSSTGFNKSWSVSKNGAAISFGSGPNFSFTPDDNGIYLVTLIATDKDGGVSAPAIQTIGISNAEPKVIAGGSQQAVTGQSVPFAVSVYDPSPVDTAAGFTYTWDFGDGTPAVNVVSPQHIYSKAGTYTVVATANDKDGGRGIVTYSVTVKEGTTTDVQLDKAVLNQSNFTYIGSFRMPTTANGWSTAYSTGGLTHRYVDGKLRFLTTSHVYSGGLVYETDYPGISTTGPHPQAQVVRNWGDVYTGEKWVGNDGGSSALSAGVLTYGLNYDQDLDRLYWNYGHSYNASNPYNPSLGYSILDDATGVATAGGAWSLADRPEKFSRGGTLRIPQWFADRYTEGKSLGVGFGGYFSIVSTASFGPSLAAVSDPDPVANPDRSSLSNVPLVGYPSGAPDRAHRDTDYTSYYDGGRWNPSNGVGYWTWSDQIYGGATWIDAPELGGVLYIARVGQGNVWYEGSTLHADRGSFEWMVYDPKDLAAVATGAKQQWEIQPKYQWTDNTLPLGLPDQAGWSGTGMSQVGGMTFDPTDNRLYVLVNSVWPNGREWYPQVYVYQVNPGSSASQAAIQGPLTAITPPAPDHTDTVAFAQHQSVSTTNTTELPGRPTTVTSSLVSGIDFAVAEVTGLQTTETTAPVSGIDFLGAHGQRKFSRKVTSPRVSLV